VKLKKCKVPGSDQTLADLIQSGGETLQSEIHKLINSVWNKEELPEQWKEYIIVPIYKKGDNIDSTIVGCYCYEHPTILYPIFISYG
jgi:hypothetical protein